VPRGERVIVFRALPTGSGQVTAVSLSALSASGPNGEAPSVRLEGSGLVNVEASR